MELTQPENEDDYNYLYTVASISLSGKNMGEYTVIDTDAVNIYYNYLDDKGKNLYYFKDLDNGVGICTETEKRLRKMLPPFWMK